MSWRAAKRSRSLRGWRPRRRSWTCCPPAPGWWRRLIATLGVHALLADGQQQGRWQADLVDITDTAGCRGRGPPRDLVWLESPTNPLLDIADLPACARRHATAARWSRSTTPSPPRCCSSRCALGAHIAMHSATKFFGGHSDLLLGVAVARQPGTRPSGCAAAGRSPAPSPARWKPSSSCAACAPWPCGWTRASAAPASWLAASPTIPPSPGCATRACRSSRPRPGRRADDRVRRRARLRGRRPRQRPTRVCDSVRVIAIGHQPWRCGNHHRAPG